MTQFGKPVYRVTRGSYRALYQQARPIVVGLCQGDLLTFREHGRRQQWTIHVESVFKHAVALDALHHGAGRKGGAK